jgi:hypothetical protein
MTHSGDDYDKTKKMGPEGDESTRVVFRDQFSNKTTEILNETGGTVIGVTDVQRGGRLADAQVPGSQGETVFVKSGAGTKERFDPAVGWLVVTDGPGRGHFLPVYYGQNAIGRGADQRIPLDFGDQRISREAHAFIIYDEAQRKFFVRDNGKSNLVRHQGNLVMMPTEMKDRDTLVVGDTTLLFIALCGSGFDWLADNEPASS